MTKREFVLNYFIFKYEGKMCDIPSYIKSVCDTYDLICSQVPEVNRSFLNELTSKEPK